MGLVLASLAVLLPGPALAQGGRRAGSLPVESVPTAVHRMTLLVRVDSGQLESLTPLDPVPTGRRFVVELVAASVGVPPGQAVRLVIFGSSLALPLPLTLQGTFDGSDQWHAYLPGRFYVDPGDGPITAAVSRTATSGQAIGILTLSGYLVDLAPAEPGPAGPSR